MQDKTDSFLDCHRFYISYLFEAILFSMSLEQPPERVSHVYHSAEVGLSLNRDETFLGTAFVAGCSRNRNNTVVFSSTKAECIITTEAAKFFLSVSVWQTTVFCDNQIELKLAENLVYQAKSKHIDVKYHYVHETLKNGFLKLAYSESKKNNSKNSNQKTEEK